MAIERMKKIFIIGEREILEEILKFIQEMGIFHINFTNEGGKNLKKEEEEKRKNIFRILEAAEEFEKKIKNISEYESLPDEIEKIEKRVLNIIKTYKKILEKRKEKEREFSLYERYYDIINSFLPFLEEKEDKEIVGVMIPKGEERELRRILIKLMKEFDFKILSKDFKEYKGYVFLISKKDAENLRKVLVYEGFPEIAFPEEVKEMGFKKAIDYIKEKIKKIPDEIKILKEEENNFLLENGKFLRSSIDFLRDLYEYYEVKERGVLFTEYLFYIEGFIPFNEFKNFKGLFENKFSPKAILLEEKLHPHDFEEVPVKLKNKFPFKYFETLLEFFSLPKYGTIDPSPFLFVFFPIYFGFMLGDIGYSTIFLLFFIFLYFKFNSKIIKNLSTIFIFCNLWGIFFGFLYGEMFGDFGKKIGLHSYFHRIEKAEILLLISIIFGVLEVSIGLFLGFLNKIRRGHLKHSLTNLSMLFGLWSLLLLFASFLNFLPKNLSIYFLFSFFMFAVISAILHGIIAPVEIFSSFAHVLSFSRLMAIGLSSAILPLIANSFKNLFPFIIIGIFAMVTFHFLAIFLGIFDPTIQGLRLQFVEFFTKFYEAGGRKYKPFLKRFKLGG